jgi:hypothetical protein
LELRKRVALSFEHDASILCTDAISWRRKSMSSAPSDLWRCRCQWCLGASPNCCRTLPFLSLLHLA